MQQQDPVADTGRWRRLAWAGAATVFACALGAAAIAVIHDTMPKTQSTPVASTRAKVPVVERPSAGAPGARAGSGAQGGTARPASDAANPSALRAMPAAPHERERHDDASATVAVSARVNAGARHDALPPEPARLAVDGLRVMPGDVASRARPDATRVAPAAADRAPSARQAPIVASAGKDTAARQPAREPVREAPRLETVRRAQCADSELLSRLVCNERVRLRFCGGRWNEHPDCMVAATRTDP